MASLTLTAFDSESVAEAAQAGTITKVVGMMAGALGSLDKLPDGSTMIEGVAAAVSNRVVAIGEPDGQELIVVEDTPSGGLYVQAPTASGLINQGAGNWALKQPGAPLERIIGQANNGRLEQLRCATGIDGKFAFAYDDIDDTGPATACVYNSAGELEFRDTNPLYSCRPLVLGNGNTVFVGVKANAPNYDLVARLVVGGSSTDYVLIAGMASGTTPPLEVCHGASDFYFIIDIGSGAVRTGRVSADCQTVSIQPTTYLYAATYLGICVWGNYVFTEVKLTSSGTLIVSNLDLSPVGSSSDRPSIEGLTYGRVTLATGYAGAVLTANVTNAGVNEVRSYLYNSSGYVSQSSAHTYCSHYSKPVQHRATHQAMVLVVDERTNLSPCMVLAHAEPSASFSGGSTIVGSDDFGSDDVACCASCRGDIVDVIYCSLLDGDPSNNNLSKRAPKWVRFDSSRFGQNCVDRGALYLSGANPWTVGRLGVAGHPAMSFPVAVPTAAGSTYYYCAVYYGVDARGALTRSMPSLAAGASAYTTITTIPGIAQRQSTEYMRTVEIYRQYNSEWYLLSNSVNPANTYVDAGGSVASNPLIYTAGGELETSRPPPAECLASHKGRVFAGCNKSIRYTHVMREGEGAMWPGIFSIPTPSRVLGLASLGDSLIVLCEQGIFAQFGDGPDRIGNGEWPTLSQISGSIGCLDSRSVTVNRAGVMWRSARGFELLPQGGGPQVALSQTTPLIDLDSYTTVLGATTSEAAGTSTWLLSNGSARILLSYDYSRGLWMQRSASSTAYAIGTWGGATIVAESTYLRCYDSVPGEHSPIACTNTCAVTFAPLTPPGGWGRINGVQISVEQTVAGDSTVTIEEYVDGSATAETATGVWTFSGIHDSRLLWTPPVQRCESVQFRVTIAGALSRIKHLAVDYRPKAGRARVPSTRRR